MGYAVTSLCKKCMLNPDGSLKLGVEQEVVMASAEITNEDEFILKCPKGHSIETFISVSKFALLFENGLSAYNQGFYTEAFSSFYTALENFRLTFAKSFMVQDNKMDNALVNQIFKTNKNSLIIYGAFVSAYSIFFKEAPDTKTSKIRIDPQFIKIRNDVFHNGYIPTTDEVAELGHNVYSYIKRIHSAYATYNFSESEGKQIPFPKILEYQFSSEVYWLEQRGITHNDIHMGTNYEIISSDLSSMSLNSIVLEEQELESFSKLLERNRTNQETFSTYHYTK
ncbi:hypothetical protein [Listeria booriae]|uniref:hypothetical protein n=1 Tax=Listeria booriae TaxID=1552123 RepID=UPI00163DC3E2|nr:hypothetical protein [Listeria booriae]MBC1306947.1 hypothetical protein [Listeria booriae]